MNEKKICFIMCVNAENYEQECLHYIRSLNVPDGYVTEQLSIKGAVSMAAGYQAAMRQSDAKYKVYLHQDVFLVNKDIFPQILRIFADETIGMIGMVGTPKMPANGMMWTETCVGKIYTCDIRSSGVALFENVDGAYSQVEAIDGLMMITQYDIPWREDLFGGWDYYDISQSMEFRRKGFRIVVPQMEEPWCIHDAGISNLEHYFDWRERFFEEYGDMQIEPRG